MHQRTPNFSASFGKVHCFWDAGMIAMGPSRSNIHKIMNTNFMGVVNLCNAIPSMIAHGEDASLIRVLNRILGNYASIKSKRRLWFYLEDCKKSIYLFAFVYTP